MSKRRSFEEILDSEFRWPTQGDKAFVASASSSENTNIDESGHSRLVLMTDGYKKAGDLMVEAAAGRDRLARDTLVFPIIFNYRHFLEISLATYGQAVGIAPNWRSHDLATLWGSVLEMLDRYGTVDPDEADPVVGEIILEFAKIDPNSYAYRYPVDRQGRLLSVPQGDLHLPTLADVMNGVSGYFDGCDAYLNNLQSTGDY
ncbi:MAG: hypothetical protein OXF98_07485 [Rhodospirillaceae bacterium]|nr:hypothetical protein [Rhodospirillaceae bacterium]